jgi:hypothetical protein
MWRYRSLDGGGQEGNRFQSLAGDACKMSWRKQLTLWTGPGLLGGITFGDWLAMLRHNRFAVDLPYWWRAAVITMWSVRNSFGL